MWRGLNDIRDGCKPLLYSANSVCKAPGGNFHIPQFWRIITGYVNHILYIIKINLDKRFIVDMFCAFRPGNNIVRITDTRERALGC